MSPFKVIVILPPFLSSLVESDSTPGRKTWVKSARISQNHVGLVLYPEKLPPWKATFSLMF